MSHEKHSPLPWHVETVPTAVGRCHKIMPIKACLYEDGAYSHRGMDSLTAKDAEFIALACNSHDALVEALEQAKNCLNPQVTPQRVLSAIHSALRTARHPAPDAQEGRA